MPAAVLVSDLVSLREMAELAGVHKGTVRMWRTRYESFPAPLVTLALGPIWSRHEFLEWLAGHEARRRIQHYAS